MVTARGTLPSMQKTLCCILLANVARAHDPRALGPGCPQARAWHAARPYLGLQAFRVLRRPFARDGDARRCVRLLSSYYRRHQPDLATFGHPTIVAGHGRI